MSGLLMFLCVWVGGGFVITWAVTVVLAAVTGVARRRIARTISLIPTGLAPVLLCAIHWADDERSGGMLGICAVFVAIVAAGSWLATLLLWKQKDQVLEESGPGLSSEGRS